MDNTEETQVHTEDEVKVEEVIQKRGRGRPKKQKLINHLKNHREEVLKQMHLNIKNIMLNTIVIITEIFSHHVQTVISQFKNVN